MDRPAGATGAADSKPQETAHDEADVRMLFSALALLVVAAVVMKLAVTQVQTLKPATAGGASAPNPTQRATELINQAMEQAAAVRAADAASQ